MATAPTPGSTRASADTDRTATFVFVDGTDPVSVDMRTMTMRDRRTIKIKLRELFGDDVDWQEALIGALWVHLRRTDATVELGDLFDRVSMVSFLEDDAPSEVSDDDPEV